MNHFAQLWRVASDSEQMQLALDAAASLDLPNWWIVGGFVRDTVWLTNGGSESSTVAINDIDIVYFDRIDTTKARDRELESALRPIDGIRWSIKNQARMHEYNDDPPYDSIEDAMFHFPETISSVGLRLNGQGKPISINCHGLDDLMTMTFRPTPHYLAKYGFAAFAERVHQKGWVQKWPLASIAI